MPFWHYFRHCFLQRDTAEYSGLTILPPERRDRRVQTELDLLI